MFYNLLPEQFPFGRQLGTYCRRLQGGTDWRDTRWQIMKRSKQECGLSFLCVPKLHDLVNRFYAAWDCHLEALEFEGCHHPKIHYDTLLSFGLWIREIGVLTCLEPVKAGTSKASTGQTAQFSLRFRYSAPTSTYQVNSRSTNSNHPQVSTRQMKQLAFERSKKWHPCVMGFNGRVRDYTCQAP